MTALGYLETKLHPTFVSSQLLSRRRLLSKLDRICMVRLALVHGAAGSGKSSLLYDWVRQQDAKVGWYSLGEEDRDPHLFFPYFVRCLTQSYPGSLTRSANLLESDTPLEALFDELATSFVNELLHFRKRVVIVLDDYHLVGDVSLIHRWIDFLVKKGPPNLTVVLVTRELPNLPLAFLRAKGMLVEIRQDDLRFDEDEAAELFERVWQRSIPAHLLNLLLAKTEGWVTGLQLVSQAIEGKPEAEMKSYLESLEGKEQFIYNYLATEVFELQPERVRNFLKFTSIVDQFCPELASLLTNENAIERIQHLDSSRLFLVHLNGEGEWFRYHHLFRDFLRRRLSIDHDSQELEHLHLRAAQCF
ncbi:MAG: AAA family ATPase, partial [Candidatus Eremiobacteraeota bacterium]|nr:AAA family ATPase [Candidatus Eremiobacteraeota bacterium]